MPARLLIASVTALLLVCASVGATTLQGKFLQNCPASVPLIHDDAIVNPGVPGGADHWHTVVGAKMNAASTPASLLSGPTTCFIQGNHSAYWAPAIVAQDGTLVGVTSMSSYYAANWLNTNAIPGGKIQPPPFGLRMIAGNSKSTTTQDPTFVHFACDTSAAEGAPKTTIPASCPAGVGIVANVNFQGCWNGRDLDSSDHKSHVAYSRTKTDANGVSLGQGCPDGWVGIPTIQSEFHYSPKAVGGLLDSDHGVGPAGHSMHADVMFAWQPQTIAELMKCVNDPARNLPSSPLCGVFTSNSSAWLGPLNAWADQITYVQANGGPAGGPA